MSIAEQKLELVKMIMEADDDTTGKMIELANQLSKKNYPFSKEEIKILEKGRDEFFASGKKGFSIEEAHTFIRNRSKE